MAWYGCEKVLYGWMGPYIVNAWGSMTGDKVLENEFYGYGSAKKMVVVNKSTWFLGNNDSLRAREW